MPTILRTKRMIGGTRQLPNHENVKYHPLRTLRFYRRSAM